jgi:hypothetical protein
MSQKNQRVVGSFADVNDETATVLLKEPGRLSLSISGTWAGTIQLQVLLAGAWVLHTAWTAITAQDLDVGRGEYKLKFTADTSGTAVVELWT